MYERVTQGGGTAKTGAGALLLDAWERAASERPAARALTLLGAGGAAAPDELPGLSAGQRDRCLLELRRTLFGSRIAAVVSCPACTEIVEFDFELDAICVSHPPADAPPGAIDVVVGDQTLRLRVPTAADLAAAGERASPDSARTALLEALLIEGPAGPPPPAEALGEDALASIDGALAAADPQADVSLGISCPACATWSECPFDAGAFLWSEIDDWATRLLWDIQALAAAYGWREADALALSPTRRRFYVEAARA
jgi:hypothetical protein